MVEVDPLILAGVGTLLVGLTGYVVFFTGQQTSKSEEVSATSTNAMSSSAPSANKKKKKSKAPKSKGVTSDSDSVEKSNSSINAVPEAVAIMEDKTTKPDKKKKAKEVTAAKTKPVAASTSTAAASTSAAAVTTAKVNEVKSVVVEAERTTVSSEKNVDAEETTQNGDWAVVENKGKSKGKKLEVDGENSQESSTGVSPNNPNQTDSEAQSPSNPTPASESVKAEVSRKETVSSDFVTQEFEAETKKVGLLIGPKGQTKIAIQYLTGAEINMPKIEKETSGSKCTISVSGTGSGVKSAIKAMKELCEKGYASLLNPPDFVEGQVTVNQKQMADIIGKAGCNIKAIQSATNVKIMIPSTKYDAKGQLSTKVKIALAGIKDQVSVARKTILDLVKYYHTEITHPGVIHKELEVESHYYNYIIGTKGSEIKHIQANYKVTVHIPNNDSASSHVLIVGLPDNVIQAERHINKLIEKVDTIAAEKNAQEGSRPTPTPTAAPVVAKVRPPRPSTPENPEEAWMKEFILPAGNSKKLAISSMLPTGKFAPSDNSPVASPSNDKPVASSSTDSIVSLDEKSAQKEESEISNSQSKPAGSWESPLWQ